jgi:hypothetical protein
MTTALISKITRRVQLVRRAKPQSQWKVGSIFIIPLFDGSCCVAQVVGREREILNSVTIALFDVRQEYTSNHVPELRPDQVFSVLLATKDLLDYGRWRVLPGEMRPLEEVNPYEHLRSNGFIGANVKGSAIVENFVNAFYGLEPWDDWYLPGYLDDFLISPDKKPVDRLRYCGRHGDVKSSSH